MNRELEELAPPAHPNWVADQQGNARREVVIGSAAFIFEIHAARESTILVLDEALTIRPDTEPVSELSAWTPFGPHGQRRVIEPLGLTATVRAKVGDDALLAVDAVLDLAVALLAQRVTIALAGCRKVRGGWATDALCRKVGAIRKPHRYADPFSLAEAIVRRGRAEAVILAAGGKQ